MTFRRLTHVANDQPMLLGVYLVVLLATAFMRLGAHVARVLWSLVLGPLIAASGRFGDRLVRRWMEPSRSVPAVPLPSDRAMLAHGLAGAGIVALAHVYWIGLPPADVGVALETGVGKAAENAAYFVTSVVGAMSILVLLARDHRRQLAPELLPTVKALTALVALPSVGALLVLVMGGLMAWGRTPDSRLHVVVLVTLWLVVLVALPAFLRAAMTGITLAYRHRLRIEESARAVPAMTVAFSAGLTLMMSTVEVSTTGMSEHYPLLVGAAFAFAGPSIVLALCAVDLWHLSRTGGVTTPRGQVRSEQARVLSLRSLVSEFYRDGVRGRAAFRNT